MICFLRFMAMPGPMNVTGETSPTVIDPCCGLTTLVEPVVDEFALAALLD
jgi:hypothetical protein